MICSLMNIFTHLKKFDTLTTVSPSYTEMAPICSVCSPLFCFVFFYRWEMISILNQNLINLLIAIFKPCPPFVTYLIHVQYWGHIFCPLCWYSTQRAAKNELFLCKNQFQFTVLMPKASDLNVINPSI